MLASWGRRAVRARVLAEKPERSSLEYVGVDGV
jgi:hypothetical protein